MKKYAIGFAIFVLAVFALPASAQTTPSVVISEINWGGSSLSTADEWLELYNTTNESLDLGGWVLTGSATSGAALELETGTSIEAQNLIVISNYPLDHEKTTLDVEPNLVTSALSLPNSNLEIMLAMPDGTVIDQVNFSSTPDYGSTNPHASAERNLTTLQWQSATESQYLTDITQLGTPGMVKIAVEVTDEPVEETIDTEEVEEIADESTEPDESVESEDLSAEPEAATEVVTDDLETSETSADLNQETEAVLETDTELASEPESESETEPEPEAPPTPISQPQQVTQPTPVPELMPDAYYLGDVLINEIVSDPIAGHEWIELYNPGADSILLDGWFITDSVNKVTYLAAVEIQPGNYFVVEDPLGKLNNDGDEVNLFDPRGNQIDSLTYGSNEIEKPAKGESLARANDNRWLTTSTITQGQINQFPTPVVEPIIEDSYENELETATDESQNIVVANTTTKSDEPPTLPDDQPVSSGESSKLSADEPVHKIVAVAKSDKTTMAKSANSSSSNKKSTTASSTTTVTGVITALPGTFGDQIAFIDGKQLYFYYADWPDLSLGDFVSVTGTPSESMGEMRIKIASADDIQVTGSTNPQATLTNADQLAMSREGELVAISGSIVERNGDKLVVRDETGEVTVVAHKNTNIRWSDLKATQVTITGIVRQLNSGTKIYPRSMSDVAFETMKKVQNEQALSGTVTAKPDLTPLVGAGLVTLTLALMTFWYLRSRRISASQV